MEDAPDSSPRPPRALFRQPTIDRWLAFDRPGETLETARRDEVAGLLRRAVEATEEGLWAVGFVAYEAAPSFDPALETHAADPGAPLAWLALCDPPRTLDHRDLPSTAPYAVGAVEPTVTPAEHAAGVARIRRWIARGDTYQVNFTHLLEATFRGDPWGLFRDLWRSQRAPYAAWIDCGKRVVCSVSPELFFELDRGHLVSRPMKGTAPRGRSLAEDRRRALDLGHSPKDRAENVMIVDMIRNDLGRIARTGSVRVSSLFDVERYESVLQLTSTVEADTDASAAEIFAALFPCASITGAPKVRTMQLIRRLEPTPRGIYTGAIGWLAPGGRARFSVAIRTAVVDRSGERLTYGTGGGIVWDSEPSDEHRECSHKARPLLDPRPRFDLLETLRWEPESGFHLLARHFGRLRDAAAYFDFALDEEAVRRRLERSAAAWDAPRRVRVRLARDGSLRLSSRPLDARPEPWRLALAGEPVDVENPFLHHKTTHRRVYRQARLGRPAADDVVLWNEAGELTETTVANLVLEIDGRQLTPPLASGLLPGTERAELLARGEIRERVLYRADLETCAAIWLVNSVRGRVRAEMLG